MSGKALDRGLRDSLFCGLFIILLIGFSPLRAQITEYAPFNGVSGIAAGPDGSMGFSGNGHIGRITTAGVVTSYQVPTSNDMSAAIAPGPDGALWFIESGNAKIGRNTTSGTITEFSLPASEVNSGVYGITAGPDANLWFTGDYGANKIVRMTTAGSSPSTPKGIHLARGQSQPPRDRGRTGWSAVVYGFSWPDRAVTASGTVTSQVATPTNTANGFLGFIAAGPDGAMWLPNWAAGSDAFRPA